MIQAAAPRNAAAASRLSGPIDRRLLREMAVRGWLAAGVMLGLVSAAAIVVQALALASVLSAAMGARPINPMPALAWLAAGVIARALCSLGAEVVAARGAEAAKASLRAQVVRAALVQRSPAPAPAEIAAIVGRGLDALDPYIGRCVPDLVLAAAVPLALTAVIAGLDWVSAIVVIAVLVLFPLFGYLVGASSGELARRRWRQVEAFSAQVADVFEGLPVLKSLGRSKLQRERIKEAGKALNRASLSTLRVAFLSALVLDTLASVSVALVAVPLGLRLLTGSVSLSAALAVLIVAPEVFVPLRRATAEFHESTEGIAAAGRALEVIGRDADRRPRGEVVPADPQRVAVRLEGVRVELAGRPEPVLADASLLIGPGEHVVVTGANGTGKSTTIGLLLGFVRPSAGRMLAGDTTLDQVDIDAWRRLIAYVPEHPTLLAASLGDNLRLARPDASDADLLDALEAAGAAGLIGRLPEGLATLIGEGGRPLSAGERQRIALARAFLRDASLYLLDEPTAHLDARTEEGVVDALRARLSGRSALIVTHRPAVLRLADRAVTLERGRFVPSAVRAGARVSA